MLVNGISSKCSGFFMSDELNPSILNNKRYKSIVEKIESIITEQFISLDLTDISTFSNFDDIFSKKIKIDMEEDGNGFKFEFQNKSKEDDSLIINYKSIRVRLLKNGDIDFKDLPDDSLMVTEKSADASISGNTIKCSMPIVEKTIFDKNGKQLDFEKKVLFDKTEILDDTSSSYRKLIRILSEELDRIDNTKDDVCEHIYLYRKDSDTSCVTFNGEDGNILERSFSINLNDAVTSKYLASVCSISGRKLDYKDLTKFLVSLDDAQITRVISNMIDEKSTFAFNRDHNVPCYGTRNSFQKQKNSKNN